MHVVLDRRDSTPLTDQLFSFMKRAILSGALTAGNPVPPTRRLASDLRVSRTVVVGAYERLVAEGYLEARQGSGTVVAAGAALARTAARSAPPARRPAVKSFGFGPLRTDVIDFRTGVPELRDFPVPVWQRLQHQVWHEMTPADLAYGEPEGRTELREAICRYLHLHRGISVIPDQMIITSGTTQAIALVASAVRSRGGGTAVVEDPVTSDIPKIIEASGLETVSVPLDERGLRVETLPRLPRISFVYVTPSHHYPLGVAMPIDRRIPLVAFARKHGCYLVEDDYDSEFRYRLPPVSSLFELDPQRVVYIGTFSKTLSPALRTAFVVAPLALIDALRQAKWHADLHTAAPDQLVLARFIDSGRYAQHLARMKRVYESKYHTLSAALERHVPRRAIVLGSPAGMHVAVRFPGVDFDDALLGRIERAGARFYPVRAHARTPGTFDDTLVIGFGHLDPQRIDEGIRLLAGTVGPRSGRRRGESRKRPLSRALAPAVLRVPPRGDRAI